MNHFISFCSLILEIYVDLFQSTRERREENANASTASMLKESNMIILHVVQIAEWMVKWVDTVTQSTCVFVFS